MSETAKVAIGRILEQQIATIQRLNAALEERDREIERLKAMAEWAHTCVHHTDAERAALTQRCPVCLSVETERAKSIAEQNQKTAEYLLGQRDEAVRVSAERDHWKGEAVTNVRSAAQAYVKCNTALADRDALQSDLTEAIRLLKLVDIYNAPLLAEFWERPGVVALCAKPPNQQTT